MKEKDHHLGGEGKIEEERMMATEIHSAYLQITQETILSTIPINYT